MHAKLRSLRLEPPHQVAFITSNVLSKQQQSRNRFRVQAIVNYQSFGKPNNWTIIFNPATFDGAPVLLTSLCRRMYPLIELSFTNCSFSACLHVTIPFVHACTTHARIFFCRLHACIEASHHLRMRWCSVQAPQAGQRWSIVTAGPRTKLLCPS